jgi:hypothetical protein
MNAHMHTGEWEVLDGKAAGIAVSIGARFRAGGTRAGARITGGKDLVAGSGITFDDHGGQELKGVPANGGCTPLQTPRDLSCCLGL